MNNPTETKTRKPRARAPVKVIVERAFVGDKTLAEAFIPVITDDLLHKIELNRTFDKTTEIP